MKFEFEDDRVDVELTPDAIGGLERLLTRGLATAREIRDLLLQIRFFQDNLDLLIEDYAGETIVIQDHTVLFHGSESDALRSIEERIPDYGPVYVAAVPRIRPEAQFAWLSRDASTGPGALV